VKAFFSFIIRWVIPLLGLIALSLIIWFVGPLLELLVPEGRRLFPKLTVEENLLLGAFRPSARAAIKTNLASCYEVFPVLAERRRSVRRSRRGKELR